ncbi:MAG: hypothetical protein ACJ74O_20345 [Frankiaceae bacterium]
MKHRKRTIGLLSALVVAMAATTAGALSPLAGPAGAATGQAQAPSDRLQVWNLNTHGMATDPAGCTNDSPCTDYREFVDYITDPTRVAYVPDIVTLQEAGTSTTGVQTPSCHGFENALEARTGLDYYCYETTQTGGAAVATGPGGCPTSAAR